MIPDEAVEAAAKAIHEAGDWEVPWTGTDWRADCARNEARAALEAAAPHIAAEVWRQGYVAGLHNIEFNGATPNPYRSTT